MDRRRRLGILALVALAVSFAASASAPSARVAAPKPARIIFVEVGQGDAAVMSVGGKVIVSDAGEFELDNVNAALESIGAKRIDVAILSHPHEDHVKNFVQLFARWEVKKAVMSRSEWWQGTDTNRDVVAAIAAEGLKPTYVRAGQTFTWGGASWEILNPPKDEYTGGSTQAANASVAYLLRVNGVEALFTGDVDSKVLDEISSRLSTKLDGPVDIFLATHHGSKYGSTKELLDVAHPRWAVLSTGPNSFGHPAPEAIARLKEAGVSIWCTDRNGTITARISAAGKLTWKAIAQAAPWWSAKTKKQHGSCVGR